MGLERLFDASVENHPHKPAVIYKDRRITYAQLRDMAHAFSNFIMKHSEFQDGVLILARNSPEQIAIILACYATGRIACPINWRMSAQELARLLASGSFKMCLFDKPCQDLFEDAYSLSGSKLFTCAVSDASVENACASFDKEIADNLYAMRYFTSGSTGAPKSILHSHAGLMSYYKTYSEVSDWKQSDIYQTQSNLFHISGFSCIISLLVGGTLVLMDRFREEEFFGVMEREGCTRVSLVPTLISRSLSSGAFLKYNFSSVKKIVYGGSSLPLAQVKKTLEVCNCALEQAYGTTETCNISVLSGEDHVKASEGIADSEILKSAGRPIKGVTVHIVDDAGNTVVNGIGEVAVKSSFLLSRVEGNIPKGFTDDGFYLTGDIGYLDSDGYLYLVDRKNDMIVSGGENIYPREVENCLAQMINDISTSAVIGVPDPLWGQKVVAFVVRYPNSKINEQNVIDFCKEHIASYKKPREVFFVDRLPMNANRKACRPALKELYEQLKNKR